MRKQIISIVAGTLLAGSAALADHHENDALIEHAMAAAPAAISAEATIMLYDGTVLREGRNGWTCMPGFKSGNDDASCNDAAWTHYFFTDKDGDGKNAEINATGVSYMLASDPPISVSCPAPPSRISSPAPPFRISSPEFPLSVSFPPNPLISSPIVVPSRMSSSSVPLITAIKFPRHFAKPNLPEVARA